MSLEIMSTLVCLWCATGVTPESGLAAFTLRDDLRRDWQHELVMFSVPEAIFGRTNVRLVGSDGAPVAHQWVPAELAPTGRKSVAFRASIPAFGTSTYRLVNGPPAGDTDLQITETPGGLRLQNRLTGIDLGGPAAPTAGPIAGVRLPSGRWIGAGQLHSPQPPERWSVDVTARGPVFAEAAVTYTFADSQTWRLRVRVAAGEPVVLIDEEFALPAGAAYRFAWSHGWNPDAMFYRDNSSRCQLTRLAEVPGDTAFLLRAWPAWWGSTPSAHWTSFCESSGDDLLVLGCREPAVWVEPERTKWDAGVMLSKSRLEAAFQLQGFRRKWLLACLRKTESVPQGEKLVAPLPQQHLIRHGDVRLDAVKDYVLAWDDQATPHPGLFLTPPELDRFRKTFAVDRHRLATLRTAKMHPYQMEDYVAYFLATGDKELGRNIAGTLFELLQGAVDGFVLQNDLRTQGTAPHHRVCPVMWSAILADLAFAPGVLTPEERSRVKAQLAFLGYTLANPDFHSPERGYSANPNMTTSARGMLGLVACCLPNHPRARDWAQLALAEVRKELETWTGPNGGWLEAPHYMTVSMDSIIPVAAALRGKGFSDTEWLYHPRLKLAMAWLAKISTPPDPRLGGDRHMPEIGNTYLGERTCLPGWAAWIWRERDPQFAQQMQWMWQAHGAPKNLGIGGAYPGFQGYTSVILDGAAPAQPPRWMSEWFDDCGAVLRAHFPGPHETYLHYIQGRLHQHYDYDEGAFILWGKGQPLCEDFGYYGRAAATDHSRVDDGFSEQLGNEGRIHEFAAGAADYLRGERAGWQRQILLVKDDDPLGPNYFVVRDDVAANRAADWRVWIATDGAPALRTNPIRAQGRFAADLVVFFPDAPGPRLSTESLTRRSGASGFASQESTQWCLHVKLPGGTPCVAVLYPVLRNQPTPKLTALAEGRIIKIESTFGTDYAVLGQEEFRYAGEGLEFAGRTGVLQLRPQSVQLALPQGGKLSYGGKVIEKTAGNGTTVSQRFPR